MASQLLLVLVDSAELELAMVNLAVNAKRAQHASNSGGAFAVAAELSVEEGARHVVICAADQGEGIPADVLSRVAVTRVQTDVESNLCPQCLPLTSADVREGRRRSGIAILLQPATAGRTPRSDSVRTKVAARKQGRQPGSRGISR